jgi:hypothetical protein
LDETTVLLREEVDELDDPLGSGEVDEPEAPLGKDEDVLLVKFESQLPLPMSVTEEVVPPVVPSLLTTKLPQTPKSMLWLCKTRALGCV